MRFCSITSCDRKHYAKDLCQYHWRKEWAKTPAGKAAVSGQNKRYRIKHIDKVRAGERKRSQRNGKAYREKNAEKIAASRKAWRESNPNYLAEWREKNRHLHNAKQLKRRSIQAQNGTYLIKPSEIKRLYSSPCANCGSIDKIHADHIIPISKGGRHSIGNLQPLCAKCNISKGSKLMFEWKLGMDRSGSHR